MNWANLKAAIEAVITDNDNQEITGAVLRQLLNNIVATIGEKAQFAGVALASTSPGTPDGPVFYITGEAGTYVNFSNIVVPDALHILTNVSGSWELLSTHDTSSLIAYLRTVNSANADFSISDENNNVIVKFKNGHIKTKNFDSEDVAKKDFVTAITDVIAETLLNLQEDLNKNEIAIITDSSANADFSISDENNNVIVKFKNGHIKTKNFDSEDILANTNIEYPQFIARGIDDSTGEDVVSTTRLTSTWVRASAGDTVQVKDATKIGGFKVYEYKSIKGNLLAKSSSFSTERYTVSNSNTTFIRILCVEDDVSVLYTNANARNNIYVTHVNPIIPTDDKLQLNSTIPDGWYISEQSEFPAAFIHKRYGNLDEEIPLQGINSNNGVSGIYDHYDELYQKYGPNGTDWISKGYISREVLGKDESNTYNIYRYTFKPKPVDVVGQATGDKGASRGINNDTLPKICLEACIHGAEKPCARALLNFIIHLCDNWKTDKFLEWIRWNVELVVIPVVNPYGYVNNTRGNSNSVDLNRNFNAGGAWDIYSDSSKGSAPYSENETKLVARNMIENADAIAYYDLHTHGSYGSYQVMTRFDYGNDVFLGNILSSVGIELIKGFTISGMLNHGMEDSAGYASGFEYFGQIGCSAGNVPYIATQGTKELGMPTASPEVTYLRYYFDVALPDFGNAYDGTYYNQYTDCMNEEYVANLILCTLRQRFIQSKK